MTATATDLHAAGSHLEQGNQPRQPGDKGYRSPRQLAALATLGDPPVDPHRARALKKSDNPALHAEADAYWQSRRRLLGVEFVDALCRRAEPERLTPHEITFLERFLDLGHRVRWIVRDSASLRSTNDFFWGEEEPIACELKTTGTKLSTITDRIVDAVSKARGHNVTKENFLIDLGDRDLTPSVAERLTNFNRKRLELFENATHDERARYVGSAPYAIARLWIMSRGMLREIDLA
ncbi:hypothetical protein [Myceligenerans crystallogenes]|uniref:Uncharacterized protein n=1 Tax=Myceligenerans crystallogenes TaxID=316335 RepID=A0ABN2N6H5_9MICO